MLKALWKPVVVEEAASELNAPLDKVKQLEAELQQYKDKLAEKEEVFKKFEKEYLKQIEKTKEEKQSAITGMKQAHQKAEAEFKEKTQQLKDTYEQKITKLASQYETSGRKINELEEKLEKAKKEDSEHIRNIEEVKLSAITTMEQAHQKAEADFKEQTQQIKDTYEQEKSKIESQLKVRDEKINELEQALTKAEKVHSEQIDKIEEQQATIERLKKEHQEERAKLQSEAQQLQDRLKLEAAAISPYLLFDLDNCFPETSESNKEAEEKLRLALKQYVKMNNISKPDKACINFIEYLNKSGIKPPNYWSEIVTTDVWSSDLVNYCLMRLNIRKIEASISDKSRTDVFRTSALNPSILKLIKPCSYTYFVLCGHYICDYYKYNASDNVVYRLKKELPLVQGPIFNMYEKQWTRNHVNLFKLLIEPTDIIDKTRKRALKYLSILRVLNPDCLLFDLILDGYVNTQVDREKDLERVEDILLYTANQLRIHLIRPPKKLSSNPDSLNWNCSCLRGFINKTRSVVDLQLQYQPLWPIIQAKSSKDAIEYPNTLKSICMEYGEGKEKLKEAIQRHHSYSEDKLKLREISGLCIHEAAVTEADLILSHLYYNNFGSLYKHQLSQELIDKMFTRFKYPISEGSQCETLYNQLLSLRLEYLGEGQDRYDQIKIPKKGDAADHYTADELEQIRTQLPEVVLIDDESVTSSNEPLLDFETIEEVSLLQCHQPGFFPETPSRYKFAEQKLKIQLRDLVNSQGPTSHLSPPQLDKMSDFLNENGVEPPNFWPEMMHKTSWSVALVSYCLFRLGIRGIYILDIKSFKCIKPASLSYWLTFIRFISHISFKAGDVFNFCKKNEIPLPKSSFLRPDKDEWTPGHFHLIEYLKNPEKFVKTSKNNENYHKILELLDTESSVFQDRFQVVNFG